MNFTPTPADPAPLPPGEVTTPPVVQGTPTKEPAEVAPPPPGEETVQPPKD